MAKLTQTSSAKCPKWSQRILISGGTGTMGRVLVQKLQNMGHQIRVLCLPGDPGKELLPTGVEVVEGNIASLEDVRGITADVDVVYHLAGVILTEDETLYEKVNVLGTRNIIEDCLQSGCRRLIYISSASVLYPKLTVYGKSKAEAEQAVRGSGLDFTIIRPTLVCDSGGSIEFNLFLKMLNKLPMVFMPGGGKALKRPVYTEDLVEGLCALVKDAEKYSRSIAKTYNFSGGKSISMRSMAELCLKHTGRHKPIIYIPESLSLLVAGVLRPFVRKPADPVQAVAGFLRDADLDWSEAARDLGYMPRAFEDFVDQIFPRLSTRRM